MAEFFQDPPALGNPYSTDRPLASMLGRLLPSAIMKTVGPELEGFGEAVLGIAADAEAAERDPPRHVPFDAWGRRTDDILVSPSWRALDAFSAVHGLVARGYERRLGAYSRLEQLARLYLFHPSSATYTCPLAMSDGAARCLELHAGNDVRLRAAFDHLVSRDPSSCWTSGQWMTERTGGSDVSGTSTIARPCADGGWRLSGTKWFTSATTSQMALTLARPEGAAAGSAGLSLFFIELRDASGRLRDITVHRLKDKLGTHALPTAELSLVGTPAVLVGEEGGGVRRIAMLLNITRLYNAVCAVAGMRRATALAVDFARRRVAFGRPLIDHPLHAATLAAMQLVVDGALQLVFHVARLLGRDECGEATDGERAILRLLTPVAKLYTGKQAIAVASEALETFGGAGYVEDTGLPRLLRDAQVLSIWEGTTNVLSLDMLRTLERTDALARWLGDMDGRLAAVVDERLGESVRRVREAMRSVERCAAQAASTSRDVVEAGARTLAFGIARTTAGALLLEQAEWSARMQPGERRAIVAAVRWCRAEMASPAMLDAEHLADSRFLIE